MTQISQPAKTMRSALVLGIANDRSIAYSCALRLKKQGYQVFISCASERLLKWVQPLAEQNQFELLPICDVRNGVEIENLVKALQAKAPEGLNAYVHSLAFAQIEALQKPLLELSEKDFFEAMDISAYSLVRTLKYLKPVLQPGASIVTMTASGSQQVVPHYHVMGAAKATLENFVKYLAFELGQDSKMRVNAISAGPLKTLAASGIPGFQSMLNMAAERSPLSEGISQEDVGAMTAFLCSDDAKHITGQTLFVDAGISVLGV
jgi:enoyl-[acyl-carrier protein] reductase I